MHRSHRLFRAFYIPWLSQQYTHYVNYVLLRNKVLFSKWYNYYTGYNIDDNIINYRKPFRGDVQLNSLYSTLIWHWIINVSITILQLAKEHKILHEQKQKQTVTLWCEKAVQTISLGQLSPVSSITHGVYLPLSILTWIPLWGSIRVRLLLEDVCWVSRRLIICGGSFSLSSAS